MHWDKLQLIPKIGLVRATLSSAISTYMRIHSYVKYCLVMILVRSVNIVNSAKSHYDITVWSTFVITCSTCVRTPLNVMQQNHYNGRTGNNKGPMKLKTHKNIPYLSIEWWFTSINIEDWTWTSNYTLKRQAWDIINPCLRLYCTPLMLYNYKVAQCQNTHLFHYIITR